MRLDIQKLVKSYKNFALKVGEFHACESEIIGLVGNNGAGKTTFLKLVLDLIVPDIGEVCSNQKSISLSEHWKEYTGSFLDEDSLIQFLTLFEFFSFIGRIYEIPEGTIKSRLESYRNFLDIDINERKYIREYSTGNKYKIGIVSTLITKPKILILDEPFNYLDPTSQNHLSLILKNYNVEEKALIILSSHDLSHITELCTRIIIIENGIFIKDLININQENTYHDLKSYFMV
jgi:ABC-2 type transport system ATP-binding protein